ncbi:MULTISPECIES: GAF domain-containing protein [Pediococcus]|jgi:L-methionine (R)-S-oxide reductase|uniref:GAF domain-containing protein n=1 Tax=Pediococcus TaxID=1253 RepID=UPI00070EA7ED|nr:MULTISPECIES: GAF domain-containing protein [Pediococcus]MCT3027483.1 GAF domain-containing protein [Pediococcus parvulus]MCT3029696.1 GAF domain-containing protein [Pediococcus parvulus]MCT3030506.1 GAF domain-containing protein [Pediococcus parvulus]MCT3035602.1 GAF domain-containing protein [Pediococcus parvulus]MDN5574694.1 GAF domain-containing protein [Pediococcus sp.]
MTQKTLSLMNQQLDALLTGETNLIANMANASALLKSSYADVNWAGFYLYDQKGDELVLGPFQGNVACMHIANGTGVCGTAFKAKKVQRIANVHEFAGHIACDTASNSEIVLPLIKNEHKIGVLDIDSPLLDRFTEENQQELEDFAAVFLQHIDTVA